MNTSITRLLMMMVINVYNYTCDYDRIINHVPITFAIPLILIIRTRIIFVFIPQIALAPKEFSILTK